MTDHRLKLYSRPGCHLCEDMIEQLQQHVPQVDFVVRNVDSDAQWRADHGLSIPVLETPGGAVLCRYALDVPVVRRWADSAPDRRAAQV